MFLIGGLIIGSYSIGKNTNISFALGVIGLIIMSAVGWVPIWVYGSIIVGGIIILLVKLLR